MRRKTGSRPALACRRRLLLAGALLAAGLAPPALAGRDRKKAAAPYALIGGTVFRDTGYRLPGAEVTVTPLEGAGQRKSRKIVAVSDARGDFAIRVPAAPLRYTISVKAAGYRAQERAVSLAGEERLDLYFKLEPR